MSRETKIIPSPYKQLAKLQDGIFKFNFQPCIGWMEEHGKVLFGNHFQIYKEDHPLILKLLVYAIGDKESCETHWLDLNKGILLTGPIGCGKTSLMLLISYFFPPEKQYKVIPSRDISFEFEKQGYSLINRYGKGSFHQTIRGPLPIVICFDDIGVEQPQKFFGNQCNVMAEILLSRYDQFISKSMITHLTTNLSASELEAIYGNRVRSRMREMFNLVAFDRGSKDKRS